MKVLIISDIHGSGYYAKKILETLLTQFFMSEFDFESIKNKVSLR